MQKIIIGVQVTKKSATSLHIPQKIQSQECNKAQNSPPKPQQAQTSFLTSYT